MKEFLLSLFKSSQERVKNPWIGSFVLSWIIYNWHVILYFIYSNDTMERKIHQMTPKEPLMELGLWIPLIFSFLYIIGMPWILVYIDDWTYKAFQRRTFHVGDRTEAKIIASIKVERARLDLETMKVDGKNIEELRSEIERLKSSLDDEKLKYNQSIQEFSKIQEELNSEREKSIEYGNEITSLKKERKNLKESKSQQDAQPNIEETANNHARKVALRLKKLINENNAIMAKKIGAQETYIAAFISNLLNEMTSDLLNEVEILSEGYPGINKTDFGTELRTSLISIEENIKNESEKFSIAHIISDEAVVEILNRTLSGPLKIINKYIKK